MAERVRNTASGMSSKDSQPKTTSSIKQVMNVMADTSFSTKVTIVRWQCGQVVSCGSSPKVGTAGCFFFSYNSIIYKYLNITPQAT